ncbi:unnamed protein product [Didymodactylos carnosus]|uniref:Uncharacterized protein n=1 Tax=Didymodactylos carnosus TaxID=1234261 RepID=A0A8S2PHJ3_9BILA|nr:unnamed protein product [Didymodactylos carnosus]CAF4046470.1 unnamed protein product [Didymodactylos carnosus]
MIWLVNLFSESINSVDSLDSSVRTTDSSINQLVKSNFWLKNLVDQHDLLIKTMCMYHQNLVNPSVVQPSAISHPKESSSTNLIQLSSPIRLNANVLSTDSLHSPINSSISVPLDINSKLSSTPKTLNNNGDIRPPSISITITGTSITRDLEQGESTLDGKLFKVQVRTKPSCTIEQMTELVKWKHFDKSKGFIMSIGIVNMKYDTPDVAIEKTANLIREFKLAYPNIKLALTTLPHTC